ncbi:hypothetical protein HDV00_008105 [Rhizophlyctis rosea]|nr:hypothetical protein HDV00_008105 [Rhizophlyctis rosea]
MINNPIPEEGESSIPAITFETPTLERGRQANSSSPPLTRTLSPDAPRTPIGGRRRSMVPVSMAPPVESGSEVAAYLQRMEDERNQLRAQLREAQELEQRANDEARSIKNQLSLRSQELQEARNELSQAEAQLDGFANEAAELRREARLAQKERDEVAERLQKERTEAEAAKEAFRGRESQLLEQVKNTKKQNRDLKSISSLMETEILNHKADNTTDGAGLQQIISAKDRQMTVLGEQLEQLNKLNDVLNSQLSSQSRELESLQAANEQLESVNLVLMEENESYQLLLQDKTMTGDFLDSAFMARTARERGMSLSFVRGPVSIPKHVTMGSSSLADELGGGKKEDKERTKEELEKHIAELEKEVQMSADEIKALTLYISKIIGKLMADDKLEAALVQHAPDDEDERSHQSQQHPQQAPPARRLRGYSLRHSMSVSAVPGPLFISNSSSDRRPSPLSQKVTNAASGTQSDKTTPSPTDKADASAHLDTPSTENEKGALLSPKPWLKRFSFFGGSNNANGTGNGKDDKDTSPRSSVEFSKPVDLDASDVRASSPPPSTESAMATPPATPPTGIKSVAPQRVSSSTPQAFGEEVDLDKMEDVDVGEGKN